MDHRLVILIEVIRAFDQGVHSLRDSTGYNRSNLDLIGGQLLLLRCRDRVVGEADTGIQGVRLMFELAM